MIITWYSQVKTERKKKVYMTSENSNISKHIADKEVKPFLHLKMYCCKRSEVIINLSKTYKLNRIKRRNQ